MLVWDYVIPYLDANRAEQYPSFMLYPLWFTVILGKAGNRNEMETGNRNWKLKLEMEMGTEKKRTNHWYNIFFIVCLVVTRILLSNGYRTGFMSLALPLLLY